MKLVEIRDLDGPNLFLLGPAIKIELALDPQDVSGGGLTAVRARLESLGISDESSSGGFSALGELLSDIVRALHQRVGAAMPDIVWRELEQGGHVALAFSWERRRFAVRLAEMTAAYALGESEELSRAPDILRELVNEPPDAGDEPDWVRDSERQVPIIGITGTNGKTTTTRLCAHVLRESGRSVGWSSSSGVYINGELVLEGDYTGPAGARRVLQEEGIDVAVLETARGGILLRGLAYESNDVSVFTNISADHLDLLGVRTVDGLTAVKSTVVKVTRANGFVVLNADDPLVRACATEVRATPLLVSRHAENPTLRNHVAAGGIAVTLRDDWLTLSRHGTEEAFARLADIPVTYGGRAGHMVENALCAAGACIALGLEPAQIAAGLASFRNTPDLNPGRLHVYDVSGTTVVIDYAHNEAGLGHLLDFGRTYLGDGGRLVSVIGTAGDRSDEALRAIGRVAAERSDEVVIKETVRYLRGRESAKEMTAVLAGGVSSVEGTPWSAASTELGGVERALADRRIGDVVVVMCIEQPEDVRKLLGSIGQLIS